MLLVIGCEFRYIYVAHDGPCRFDYVYKQYPITAHISQFRSNKLSKSIRIDRIKTRNKSLAPYTKVEDALRDILLKKADDLTRKLRDPVAPQATQPDSNFQKTLTELEAKYPIRNKILLIKSGVALVFTIGLFFLHALPQFQSVSLGWTALLGAILLLILADVAELDVILARVEWSTLMFFAALFILMEALAELGLIEVIGHLTEYLIFSVDKESRLMVALLIMLWVSAIVSAFVDNIPLTTMMVKVTISLAKNESLHLPLQPLVWALALGACLGGNGTLIGASANVVCAGVAEQHGYKITFIQFFKQSANYDDDDVSQKKKIAIFLKWLKIGLLVIVWCIFTTFLLLKPEHEEKPRILIIPANTAKDYPIHEEPQIDRLGVILTASFEPFHSTSSESDKKSKLTVQVQRLLYDEKSVLISTQNISDTWELDILDPNEVHEHSKDITLDKTLKLTFPDDESSKNAHSTKLVLHLETTLDKDFPLQVTLNDSPIVKNEGVIYAGIVLLGLYVLIIWDIVHRTFAAIIASTLAIGILAILNNRPTMETIMAWVDNETLLLLFGMMVIVAILAETGAFDYLAVYAYKITEGQVWPLINCLCVFTAIFSSFLDNVTTVLLMTPVTIRLCEVMRLDPVPILMCMIFYSNIGGALTPVGDPPNVIIASNSFISSNGVNFAIFTLHMVLPVVLIMLTTNIHIRLIYRNLGKVSTQDQSDLAGLKHEIKVWKHAAESIAPYSKDEEELHDILLKKANDLKRKLREPVAPQATPPDFNFQKTLTELEAKYPIRNKMLLIKSTVALVFVIGLFFLHALPQFQSVSLGWTALLGAILLLILADVEELDVILARVEWSTLMFFAALFILMEALAELGLIEVIGHLTEYLIFSVDKESRLMVALLIMLWVSAIVSAFVDNIPLTTMMVKVTISLAKNESLHLPLQPLVWALALGACLGGNGTLIGASANVVCAGVAEQHGYKITFIQFFKMGFPIMISSIILSTIYLLIAHVAFEWH